MDLSFSPEQLERRRAVAAFLDDCDFEPRCDNWIVGFDRELSKRIAARGWLGLTWPAAYGGAGLGYVDRLSVTELFLTAGAPLASHWFADRQMGPAILHNGTEEQKSRWLPEILSGDATFCIGMSEAQAGSDLAAVRTRAVRDGRGWRISGHKIWTSLAQHSEYIYLLARTDPGSERHHGLSEFVVPMSTTGIEITAINDMSGEHHFNEVFLDDVLVDESALVGTEGRGWYQVTGQLGYERAGLERIMSVWPLLVEMRAEAGDDTHRLRELGELEAEAIVARQLVYRVAWMCDHGAPPDHDAALAKLIGNRLEQKMVEVASRWAGIASRLARSSEGAAFAGHLADAWLIAPSFSIRGGTAEILRGIVARRALGLG